MPHLRVSAGPSLAALEPITDIVNAGKSHRVSSPLFDGEIAANIRGFVNEQGDKVADGSYFSKEGKDGITWSIMVKGRFLCPINADDILFGNTFERPLKLPWGTGAALKFANYIDPTLTHDLTSTTKPWALSPLISTMPFFVHERVQEETEDECPFPPEEPIKDSTSQLHLAHNANNSETSFSSSSSSSDASMPIEGDTADRPKLKSRSSSLAKLAAASRSVTSLASSRNKASQKQMYNFSSSSQRRSYFAKVENRKQLTFGPQDLLKTDFCYGFFTFYPKIALRIPGGIEFDLMHYWDKQPVRFVCCARKGWTPPVELEEVDDDQVDATPWGRVFWCIALELVEDTQVSEQ